MKKCFHLLTILIVTSFFTSCANEGIDQHLDLLGVWENVDFETNSTDTYKLVFGASNTGLIIQTTVFDAHEITSSVTPFQWETNNEVITLLKDDNYKVIKESLELFLRYVNVITKGKLDVKIEFHDLPNFCGKTRYSSNGPRADIDNPSEAVNSISKELRQQTDWWWVIYPSAVPEDGINGIANNAGFDDNYAFITGGMGAISNNKPMFIVNDRWIVRRPPHLGRGDYTSIERRAYLPNWFQHEFYHHLYRSYPDLGLEPSGHDWHNRAFWPSDFNGSFEADFYYESFHKRLKDVKPHLNYILNPTYKPSNEILNSLDLSQFLNQTFDASEDIIKSGGTPNDWHVGKIIRRTFGVRYHPDHVSRILRALGWKYRKAKMKTQSVSKQAGHPRRQWVNS